MKKKISVNNSDFTKKVKIKLGKYQNTILAREFNNVHVTIPSAAGGRKRFSFFGWSLGPSTNSKDTWYPKEA